jgi:hypothetical protein
VLAGGLLVAALALLVEAVLAGVERLVTPRPLRSTPAGRAGMRVEPGLRARSRERKAGQEPLG